MTAASTRHASLGVVVVCVSLAQIALDGTLMEFDFPTNDSEAPLLPRDSSFEAMLLQYIDASTCSLSCCVAFHPRPTARFWLHRL